MTDCLSISYLTIMSNTKKSSRTAVRPPPRVVVETVRPTAPNEPPTPAGSRTLDVYLHGADEEESSCCKGYLIAVWIALFVVFVLAVGAGVWARNR